MCGEESNADISYDNGGQVICNARAWISGMSVSSVLESPRPAYIISVLRGYPCPTPLRSSTLVPRIVLLIYAKVGPPVGVPRPHPSHHPALLSFLFLFLYAQRYLELWRQCHWIFRANWIIARITNAVRYAGLPLRKKKKKKRKYERYPPTSCNLIPSSSLPSPSPSFRHYSTFSPLHALLCSVLARGNDLSPAWISGKWFQVRETGLIRFRAGGELELIEGSNSPKSCAYPSKIPNSIMYMYSPTSHSYIALRIFSHR